MCMAYSNSMDVLLFSQEEEGKTNSAAQVMKKNGGQKVHWQGQVALVNKTSYL